MSRLRCFVVGRPNMAWTIEACDSGWLSGAGWTYVTAVDFLNRLYDCVDVYSELQAIDCLTIYSSQDLGQRWGVLTIYGWWSLSSTILRFIWLMKSWLFVHGHDFATFLASVFGLFVLSALFARFLLYEFLGSLWQVYLVYYLQYQGSFWQTSRFSARWPL